MVLSYSFNTGGEQQNVEGGTESSDKIPFDFKARKTEAEWAATLDRIGKKAAPIWFDWLKWVLVMVAIEYGSKRAHSSILFIAYVASMFFFLLNIQGWFYSFEFQGFPFIKTEALRRGASIVMSGILTFAVWQCVTRAVDLLVSMQN